MICLCPNFVHKPYSDVKSTIVEAVVDCSPVSGWWTDLRAHVDRQRTSGCDDTGRRGGA